MARDPDRRVPFHEWPAPVPKPRRADDVPRVRVERVGGEWQVLDALGRVVVLHGLNVGQGSKNPPWRSIGMGDEDAFRLMRSWGVNAIRLVLPWEALEPEPRRFDMETLAYVRWFLDQARSNDMLVVLDNHHNEVSRCFGGTGAPRWAHRPGVIPDEAAARDCRYVGYPGLDSLPHQLRWWADFWDGAWTPDDLALQDHVVWAWQKLAEVVRGHPALLGYGPFNEPHCYTGLAGRLLYPGETRCEEALSAFYRRFAFAIRAVDPDSLLFVEPPLAMIAPDWDGADTGIELPPVPGVVLSVHWYDGAVLDAGCDSTWDRDRCDLAEFLASTGRLAADRFGTARVLTEHGVHGCKRGAAEDLAHQMVDVEDAGASSFVWNLFVVGDTWGMTAPRTGGEDMSLVVPEIYASDPSQAGRPRCHAGAFVRPVPRRIAGEPIAWGFDRSFDAWDGAPDRHHDGRAVAGTDTFTLSFRQTAVVGDTHVFVPRALVFGEDPATEAPEFTVDVSDGTWRWAPDDPNVLVWTANPAVPEHTLTIKTWGGRRAPGNGIGDCVPP
ncbi:MAG: cellulase family glycosylhydrolase [Deltaproteobacteria bacterium]|nr:cellulase family glycosylhydrolase [Deltaproteobacteria bacterium]